MYRNLFIGAAVAALAAAFGAAAPASAATTFVSTMGGFTGNERCLIGGPLCTGNPGATFNGAQSIQTVLEAELGSLSRLDDNNDEIWQTNGPGFILQRARYAAYNDTLGYVDSSGGPLAPFTPLLGVLPNNKVSVSAGNPFIGSPEGDVQTFGSKTYTKFEPTNQFRFVLRRPDGFFLSSRASDNPLGADAMVTLVADDPTFGGNTTISDGEQTYRVANRYIIAFADLTEAMGETRDLDFNDYVAEFVTVAAVPLPAALPLFLSGLVGFALIARNRKS